MTTFFNIYGTERTMTGTNQAGNPVHRHFDDCCRCGGSGVYRWHTRFGPAAGTCFKCGGNGKGAEVIERLYTESELVKAQAARDKRLARAAEKREAKAAAREAAWQLEVDKANALADEKGTQEAIDELKERAKAHGDDAPYKKQLAALYQRAKAEREAAWAKRDQDRKDNSAWIGEVGERREFDLTVRHTIGWTVSRYPLIQTFINICETPEGLAVIYKGANCWEKGARLVVKATIKEHGERDGVKQTVIQRPKVLEEIEEETNA